MRIGKRTELRSGAEPFYRPTTLPLYRPSAIHFATLALLVSACSAGPDISPGVSWELAEHRANTISDVRYALSFSIPAFETERIRGSATVTLTLNDARHALVLDFVAPPEDVLSVRSAGESVEYEVRDEHVIVPAAVLQDGRNEIQIEFLAGDLSLNRNPEFLYTLFVPDRARTSFPCFDQPNMKAVYALTLETPVTWRAVANGPLTQSDTLGDRVIHRFADTSPLSTYLFSFAAGRFEVETAERNGRLINMYHRETDAAKVERNRDEIFDLHASALSWLEEYTGIPYPFEKFDFVAVPSFQYGGMEHAGAILYRASSLFHEETATQSAKLGRAGLIAHETAHMWFGDLVTMNWFDDVWTKEVFAGFMSAKIVNPSFPDINHEHRFFLNRYPSAYGVDRTAGANPIRQPLENMNQAGTLYGAIIYQKAPIVMRQLERLIGEGPFREGLHRYLDTYAYGNATWSDLIAILDDLSEEDLRSWSEVWVDQPNRPTIDMSTRIGASGSIETIEATQSDPTGGGRIWVQNLQVTLGWDDSTATIPLYLNGPSAETTLPDGTPPVRYLLAGGEGFGYGLFELDEATRSYLLDFLPDIQDPLTRGVAWVTLWDDMLEGRTDPSNFLDLAMRALPVEDVELNIQRILSYLSTAYWRFTPATERTARASAVEELLWELLQQAETTSRKSALFSSYRSMVSTERGVNRLLDLWQQRTSIAGLPLFERDYISLAQRLALLEAADYDQILTTQLDRIENPDRRASFEFVMPALSSDEPVRDEFFTSLERAENREHEPWVLTAVSFLHHPLRAATAEKYLLPSLELLEEIQITGDIFFPQRWLGATLGGHNSATAAATVRSFLEERPDYPFRLRLKIEQSADVLFRAANTLGERR